MRRKLISAIFVLALSGCVTMQAGLDALNSGNLALAEQEFQQALNRGDTMAYNNLGVVYQRRGETQKAISYYTVAARWGHQIAVNNLLALGAPVPAADLADARAQRNAANTAATQQLIQALQPAPMMRPPVQCRSYRVGNSVQTDCN